MVASLKGFLLLLLKKFQEMTRIFTCLFIFTIIPVFIFSCRHEKQIPNSTKPSFMTFSADSTEMTPPEGKQEILYGLLTPTEISAIFTRLGISYNETVLNPTSNKEMYTSSAEASLNLGIYGVDFGYVRMFGISQEMIDYILTIRNISDKLGIPDKFLTDPIRKIEDSSTDPDSIMILVNRSYKDIEDHLRIDGRESTAGLMLLGGWVEALYITTQLLFNTDKPDRQVVEKIAQQKYTLTSLLGFMRNYYDDPVVVYYTKKLIFLKRYFDSFDIYFQIGDLEIDTTKKVLKASNSQMTISIETLNDIRDYIHKLRTEMVTP